MLQMYVCVCIFGLIHTSYIQPVLHTYTYKHAGFLMYEFMTGQDHASQLFWLPTNVLLLVCRKNVSGAYIVSAHFGKQHTNLVIPIIDLISVFTTGGLTHAQKKKKKSFSTSIL